MFGIVIALIALILAAVVLVIGWRSVGRIRRRLDDAAQSLDVLQSARASGERDYNRVQQRQSETAQALAALQSRLEDLDARFVQVESYAAVCVPPRPSNSGMNINRRVEAVRMLREGRTEEQVAAELALALSEVRLIGHLEKNLPVRKGKHGGVAA